VISNWFYYRRSKLKKLIDPSVKPLCLKASVYKRKKRANDLSMKEIQGEKDMKEIQEIEDKLHLKQEMAMESQEKPHISGENNENTTYANFTKHVPNQLRKHGHS